MPDAPAGWYEDPLARADHRYWDGRRWTEHVSRGGQVAADPLESAADVSAPDRSDPGDDPAGERFAPAGTRSTGPARPDADRAGTPSSDPAWPHGGRAQGGSTAWPEGGVAWPGAGRRVNSKAIASVALAVVSYPLSLILLGVMTAIAAIVLGVVARREVRESGGTETGDGLALAGIIGGAVLLVLVVVLVVALVAFFSIEPFPVGAELP